MLIDQDLMSRLREAAQAAKAAAVEVNPRELIPGALEGVQDATRPSYETLMKLFCDWYDLIQPEGGLCVATVEAYMDYAAGHCAKQTLAQTMTVIRRLVREAERRRLITGAVAAEIIDIKPPQSNAPPPPEPKPPRPPSRGHAPGSGYKGPPMTNEEARALLQLAKSARQGPVHKAATAMRKRFGDHGIADWMTAQPEFINTPLPTRYLVVRKVLKTLEATVMARLIEMGMAQPGGRK